MEVVKIGRNDEKRCCEKKYTRNQKYKESYNPRDYRRKEDKCPCPNVIVNCDSDNNNNNGQCTCSGTLNIDFGEIFGSFLANICPNCNLNGSNVRVIILANGNFSFTSNFVFPPVCHATSVGTVLDTGGTGLVTTGSGDTFPATFTLNLLETNVGDDVFIFTVSGFDNMGNPFVFETIQAVPDSALVVSACTNSFNTPITPPMNIQQNFRANLKGKMITYINGQLIEKDF
jgi:hypothetical protein